MSQTPAEPIKTLPLVMEEPRGRKKPPRHLADLTPAERKALLEEQGLPGFRAKQLSTHYFARLVDDPEQMTDLPSGQRADLVGALLPELMTPLRTMEADKGTTRKVLWKLFDGALVESVLMRYPDRATMCVSSQAGCGMACPFCATGQGGLQRNMSTAEIVEQVVAGARSLARGEVPGGPGRVSNVVFMGGDPPKNGDHPDAKPVFDLFASQLLEAACALNNGTDLSGNALKGTPQLTIGAVANPGASDLALEIDNMKRKADAGAEFFQTQAIYDVAAFDRFMTKAKPERPVLAGIIPIKSVKMAQYMNDKIPGVDIPQDLIDKIDAAGDDKAKVADISIVIASNTVRELRDMTRGVHVMAIGWEDKIPAILDRASA